MIEKSINSLRCGGVLISWKVMQIAQIASLGVLWRGGLGSPVSFVGVLQRVMVICPAAAYGLEEHGSAEARIFFSLWVVVWGRRDLRAVFANEQFLPPVA